MRHIKIALAGALAGLALLAFRPWQVPTLPRGGSAQTALREPAWRACLRDIASDPDPVERARDLRKLAEALPVADLQSAIEALQGETEGTPGAQLCRLLRRRWADHTSPASTVATMAGLPGDSDQAMASPGVGYGLARQNPADAVTFAARLPTGQAREGLLQYAVQQWARSDRNSAIAWAGRLPDPRSRDEFLSIIAVEWAAQEPAQAAAFAASTLTAGRPRDEALLQIATCWMRAAPEQAADWISHLPGSEGEVRDFALGQLTATWARKDLVKAAQWIIQLPADGSRDAASSAYVPVLAVTDPDLAVQWLQEIQDPALRASTLESLHNL